MVGEKGRNLRDFGCSRDCYVKLLKQLGGFFGESEHTMLKHGVKFTFLLYTVPMGLQFCGWMVSYKYCVPDGTLN